MASRLSRTAGCGGRKWVAGAVPRCATVLSLEAVALLRAKGFKVCGLEEGYPEWRAAGLPVEASTAA